RNGDTENDPTVADIAGSWPHETPAEWHVSSWTGDWYELQKWERRGEGFYYHAQQRRYGGDLQGVIDELGYLKELGINAIYFNPLFESPSLHKYDATMYHHIDNNFGPDPEGDRRIWARENPSDPSTWKWSSADNLFLALIARAHELGMRVIIDGVFNHVGMTFWAFRDVVERQSESPYKDWFIIKSFDDPATAANEFDYEGWYGVRELPEIREDANGLVTGPREHVHEIVKRWMDPNGDGDPSDGIDGWRLDVAEMVRKEFWLDFRTWVREINPEAYLVGEVWWDDWNNEKMFNAEPWLQGDVFDAVMNYRWAREVNHFFKDRERKTTASEFDSRLKSLRSDYRSDVNYVLMNLMDSHDTDRLASQIVNVDASYDKEVGLQGNPDYDVRKPNGQEIRIQKLIALFQMTCPGAPTIFYGTEAGMWGADDPDERKPMLWPDMVYDVEKSHPFGKVRPADENKFNEDLFAHYSALINLRRGYPALSLGDFRTILTDDERDLYAFVRAYGDQQVLVVINNDDIATHSFSLPAGDPAAAMTWTPLFVTQGGQVVSDGTRYILPQKTGAVLLGGGQR
ncbi:MAG: glycoside hydrolase family 13 protein, partial [Ignavibacteria bacterium]|nr:glycoside hydrolase family 13 protein [Ignavibacteria bacterium]